MPVWKRRVMLFYVYCVKFSLFRVCKANEFIHLIFILADKAVYELSFTTLKTPNSGVLNWFLTT